MFGSEILDIIIGLIFVYLLLSLVCSAINEYIASLLNKRGKVLFEGLESLLKDSGVAEQFYKHPLVESVLGEKKLADRYMAREEYIRKHWWPAFRWLYRLVSWIRPRDNELRHFRLASYLPARTFALALVEAAGYHDPATRRAGAAANAGQDGGNLGQGDPNAGQGGGQGGGNAVPDNANAGQAGGPGGGNTQHPWTPLTRQGGGPTPEFERVLQTLMKDSAIDVTEFASLEVAGRLAASGLPDAMKTRLSTFFNDKEYELQKLHDSVEVWFNNKMDRVSGTYKRHVQAMLFAVGLVLSVAVNADTIDLWRRLSTDKKLRDGLAQQAVGTFDSIRAAQARDTARTDTTATDSAATGTPPVHASSTITTAAADSGNAATHAVTTDTPKAGATTTDTAGNSAPRPDKSRGGLLGGQMRHHAPEQEHARLVLDSAMAALDQTQLRLGWSRRDAQLLGVLVHRTPRERARADTVPAKGGRPARIVPRPLPEWRVEWWPFNWYRTTFWPKLIGLLITAFALSLGAPFWFDMLNKVINIRSAGRAPDERSKAPEAAGKRPAELPTK